MSARWRAAVAASAVCASVLVPANASGAPLPPLVARLVVGRPAFWNSTAAKVELINGKLVRRFRLEVGRGGHELRIALNEPANDGFNLVLQDPRGVRTTHPPFGLSAEARVPRPLPGTWTVWAWTSLEHSTMMRARALLAPPDPPPPPRPVTQLPNLVVVPPFEFGFESPVFGAEGILPVPYGATSCQPHEVALHASVRCLRFSTGPANVGAGPLVLDVAPYAGVGLPGTAVQYVRRSDGWWTARPGGPVEYHAAHRHYHHAAFGRVELLRVADVAAGRLEPVGEAPTPGICLADALIAEWESFDNSPAYTAPSRCVPNESVVWPYLPSDGMVMGLSPGWGDVLSWRADAAFVPIGVHLDGRYVVRATADPGQAIAESNERDNASYAYIEIRGATVYVLERGRGTSPWDRNKVVLNDRMPPTS